MQQGRAVQSLVETNRALGRRGRTGVDDALAHLALHPGDLGAVHKAPKLIGRHLAIGARPDHHQRVLGRLHPCGPAVSAALPGEEAQCYQYLISSGGGAPTRIISTALRRALSSGIGRRTRSRLYSTASSSGTVWCAMSSGSSMCTPLHAQRGHASRA